MPNWWLDACCCKRDDPSVTDLKKAGGGMSQRRVLDAPLEWQVRTNDHLMMMKSHYVDDESSHHHIDTLPSRDARLELKFWASHNDNVQPQLASWVGGAGEEESRADASIERYYSSDDELPAFTSEFGTHRTQEPIFTYRKTAVFPEDSSVRLNLSTRHSAQFFMDHLSSVTCDDVKAASSSSDCPITLRAQDLISSDSIPAPPPAPIIASDDETCSTVGDEGLPRNVIAQYVEMLVAKRNKFVRVGDFTTSIDEKEWKIGRRTDERHFAASQIEHVYAERPLMKLVETAFTRQHFSNFTAEEFNALEPLTVSVTIHGRQVPYIIIFSEPAEKAVFVTRLNRMRR